MACMADNAALSSFVDFFGSLRVFSKVEVGQGVLLEVGAMRRQNMGLAAGGLRRSQAIVLAVAVDVGCADTLVSHGDHVAVVAAHVPLLVLVATLQSRHVILVLTMNARQLLQLIRHVLRCPEIGQNGTHVLVVAMSARIRTALDSMVGLDRETSLIVGLNQIKRQLARLDEFDVSVRATSSTALIHLLLSGHYGSVIVDGVVVLSVLTGVKRAVSTHDK